MFSYPRLCVLFFLVALVFQAVNGTSHCVAEEPKSGATKRPMESLDRGLVALEVKNAVYLSWRMLGTDPVDIGFNIYRNGKKVNAKPITDTTNYTDSKGGPRDRYSVETLSAKPERSAEVAVWPRRSPTAKDVKKKPAVAFKEIPLPAPPSADNQHKPGDMSVGDLDGNGNYELVFMWEGAGPYLEAVSLEGKSFWRISLGVNVTHNAAPLLVYDLDEDGKAEVVCITGPGTKDASGKFLSRGPAAEVDHAKILKRKSSLVEDPAFITVFDGETGLERETILFWPPLGPESEMKKVWGDDRGHRSNSIKGAILYHKEFGPLVVMARGIYSRVAMKAYRFDAETLQAVWTFDSQDESGKYLGYRSQGNHSVAVGDVDNDGSDELIYGACAIDHDGTGMYTTGMGHGDAHALGDLMPDHPGLEFFQPHEGGDIGVSMREAATGKIIWDTKHQGDVGRAWCADVDAKYRGAEVASTATPNLDCQGREIPEKYNPFHQPLYFDGRVQKARRSGSNIDGEGGRILTGWYYGATSIHSSKNDANLVADILGDWREECVFLRNDRKAFVLFTSWLPTDRKNYTLMHDPTYRMNIAVQNVGYNQPAHVGYYFADGMPVPEITLIPRNRP